VAKTGVLVQLAHRTPLVGSDLEHYPAALGQMIWCFSHDLSDCVEAVFSR
jgi:hypothetical protein